MSGDNEISDQTIELMVENIGSLSAELRDKTVWTNCDTNIWQVKLNIIIHRVCNIINITLWNVALFIIETVKWNIILNESMNQ